ncbi:peptidoglycan DD-metalloendopeptidase family protein [Flavobacteriales bacterium]|nr:peptidoglycan DD-metalloendopeptidase family protein [Flavobacteriales bacterium]
MNKSKQFFFFPFVVALIALSLSGCSNTRDGVMYRVYHNTNARFNGYFYAMEAMEEAELTLQEGYEENWDEILPVFPPVDESTAQEVYPLMERAIEKCTNVVDKHTMSPSRRDQKNLKRPELNKWIDENYDIIARAHLIKGDEEKALEIFQYLVRTLDYPDAQAWSNAWMARTYMAMGDRVRASNTLIKAAQIDQVDDPAVRAYVYQVYASYHLNNDDVEAAITMLEKALLQGEILDVPGEVDRLIEAADDPAVIPLQGWQLPEEDVSLRNRVEEEDRFVLQRGQSDVDPSRSIPYPPIQGTVSSSFDAASGHYGVDFVAPEGSIIHAVDDGVVVLASYTSDGGYVVSIQHEENRLSVYKHNKSLLVESGDRVIVGDPIAVLGSTGTHSTGPHSHFEWWVGGQPLDPANWLPNQPVPINP